jgi:hypothetical protein
MIRRQPDRQRSKWGVTDWATISSFATGAGTLVLAIATFGAVRSGNRAARTAERALQAGLRPLLMHSRLDDPQQKIMWIDRHWALLNGGRAHVQAEDGNIYLAMSLRNAGSGIAVLHGWSTATEQQMRDALPPADPETFRRLTRDEYVAPGDTGFFQGSIRDTADDAYDTLLHRIEDRELFGIDLLYSDHEGGQRTISRFTVVGRDNDEWLATVGRHWNLDRDDPR